MKDLGNKVNWNCVADGDIPCSRVSTKSVRKHKNYLHVPSTKQVGEVNALGWMGDADVKLAGADRVACQQRQCADDINVILHDILRMIGFCV